MKRQQRRGIDKLLSRRKRQGIVNKVTPKPEHIDWLRRYEDATTFEPMNMEEYLNGEMSFRALVWENANWFETWATDAHLAVTSDLPEEVNDYEESIIKWIQEGEA